MSRLLTVLAILAIAASSVSDVEAGRRRKRQRCQPTCATPQVVCQPSCPTSPQPSRALQSANCGLPNALTAPYSMAFQEPIKETIYYHYVYGLYGEYMDCFCGESTISGAHAETLARAAMPSHYMELGDGPDPCPGGNCNTGSMMARGFAPTQRGACNCEVRVRDNCGHSHIVPGTGSCAHEATQHALAKARWLLCKIYGTRLACYCVLKCEGCCCSTSQCGTW